jgi:hypothetical protein
VSFSCIIQLVKVLVNSLAPDVEEAGQCRSRLASARLRGGLANGDAMIMADNID